VEAAGVVPRATSACGRSKPRRAADTFDEPCQKKVDREPRGVVPRATSAGRRSKPRRAADTFDERSEEKLEAAGVEPASESTPSQKSTCVAALESSRPPSKSDGNRRSLAPECLAAAPRGLRDDQPAVMTSFPAQQASARGTSLLN